jgi:diguanylate cyclase (GGDEF)-like protein
MPNPSSDPDDRNQQRELYEELTHAQRENRSRTLLLSLVAAMLGAGALSLFLPHTIWPQSNLEIRIPSTLLFVGLMVTMVLTFYLVRYESETRKLQMLMIQKTLAAQSAHAASMVDSLTNAYTRTFLRSLLDREIAMAERNSRPLALMMCDVNNFKMVNDRYGHLMGDDVLAQIVNILKACVRGSDHVVRYGGDEFLLIMPETDAKGAVVVRDRIVGRVQEWDANHPVIKIPISISVGTFIHAAGNSVEQDLAAVDLQMYSEKDKSEQRERALKGRSN